MDPRERKTIEIEAWRELSGAAAAFNILPANALLSFTAGQF